MFDRYNLLCCILRCSQGAFTSFIASVIVMQAVGGVEGLKQCTMFALFAKAFPLFLGYLGATHALAKVLRPA
jgi:hypothetical protein